MHPILFEIGRFPVYTYGVLLAAAYLAGLQLAIVRARRAGLDSAKMLEGAVIAQLCRTRLSDQGASALPSRSSSTGQVSMAVAAQGLPASGRSADRSKAR